MTTTRRTTQATLDGMKRADHLRAQRASSSMHPSWLDDEHLARVTREYFQSINMPLPEHCVSLVMLPRAS